MTLPGGPTIRESGPEARQAYLGQEKPADAQDGRRGGFGLRLGADLELGRLSDELHDLNQQLHKLFEGNPIKSPFRQVKGTSVAGANTTYQFVPLPRVEAGYVWSLRRWAIWGADPTATPAGGSVLFRAADFGAFINGAALPAFIPGVLAVGGAWPQYTTWARGVAMVYDTDQLIVLTNGAVATTAFINIEIEAEQWKVDDWNSWAAI